MNSSLDQAYEDENEIDKVPKERMIRMFTEILSHLKKELLHVTFDAPARWMTWRRVGAERKGGIAARIMIQMTSSYLRNTLLESPLQILACSGAIVADVHCQRLLTGTRLFKDEFAAR
jgi:hypothetical protein